MTVFLIKVIFYFTYGNYFKSQATVKGFLQLHAANGN